MELSFIVSIFEALKKTIPYRHSEIAYHLYGHGPKPVLCLHGYGETGAHFFFLEKSDALREYCFIAPDLPWHGDTRWREGLNWNACGLGGLVKHIMAAEGFSAATGICIIGFSMGGRLALTCFQQQQLAVEKIVLLAPDGLKVNPWYWFGTQTAPGRRLFRFTMNHPGWFFFLLKMANRLKLINASVFKFVKYYIGDENARQLLYKRWITLRSYKPDLARCRALIRNTPAPVTLLYGKYDRIIRPPLAKKFQRGLEDLITSIKIDSGHQVLHEKHAQEIIAAMQIKPFN